MIEILIKLAEEYEDYARIGGQSMSELVVAMAIQDDKDAKAIRRTIALLKFKGIR